MPILNLRAPSRLELAQGSTAIPADLIAAASICLFLTTAAVCARLFTKAIDLRRIQIDDYIIIFAGVGFASFACLLFVGANSGLGAHIWTVSASALKRALLYSNLLDILYTPIMLAVKLAILVQIDRLFSGTRKKIIYRGVRVMIVLNVLCYTAMFFVHVFSCVPRAKIFDASVAGKCISQNATIIASGSVNVASDVVILLFAVWGVGRLRLSKKRQTLVSLVFAIGSFACVASICRLVYGVKVNGDPDFTAAIWPVHLWSLAELTSAVYIACCPTFPRLIRYIQGVPSSRSPTRNGWASTTTTRFKSVSEKSKDVKAFPEIRILHPTPHSSPNLSSSPNPEKLLPRAPIPQAPLLRPPPPPIEYHKLPVSVHSPLGREKVTSYFAPSERPISRLSCESRATKAIEEILSSYDPAGVPQTPLSPATPLSPTTLYSPTTPGRFSRFSRFSRLTNVDFEDAVHVKIMPVYFATEAITKTSAPRSKA